MARRRNSGFFTMPSYAVSSRPTGSRGRDEIGSIQEPDYQGFRFKSYFAPQYRYEDPNGFTGTVAKEIPFEEDTQFAVEARLADAILALAPSDVLTDRSRLNFRAPEPRLKLPDAPEEPRIDLPSPPTEPLRAVDNLKETIVTLFFPLLGRYKERRAEKRADASYRARHEVWRIKYAEVERANQQALARFRQSGSYETYNTFVSIYRNRVSELKESFQEAIGRWREADEAFSSQRNIEVAKLKEIIAKVRAGDDEGFADYFRVILNSLPFPIEVPREINIRCSTESSLIFLELTFPAAKNIRFWKWHKFDLKDVSEKEKTTAYDLLFFSLIVRTVYDVASASQGPYDTIVVNALSKFKDPATGRDRKNLVASASVAVDDAKALQITHLDPRAAFIAWKGVSARSLVDAVPVKPVLVFDTNDGRFVASKDILAEGEMRNLAEMDWEDFEHLIRQLFERKFQDQGAEVHVTQSSRDRGVDAVIFNPNPLTGGKIVIQAKRYTLTVGVAAVRELYGTMIAEAATRGILVTTSDFGNDSISFAKDKNITLINGQNLLSLFQDIGHTYSIDLKAARDGREGRRSTEHS